jgi:hypothetical protein
MRMMWISYKLDPVIKVDRQTAEMTRLCPEAVEYFTLDLDTGAVICLGSIIRLIDSVILRWR